MQQTDKYKLNKPGVDDPIAIAPLNENADKIEAALSAKADAADVTDLNQRVTMLEAKKVVFGSVLTEKNIITTVELGFTPGAVLIHRVRQYSGVTGMACTEQPCAPFVVIVEGGFQINVSGGSVHVDGYYNYIAFG